MSNVAAPRLPAIRPAYAALAMMPSRMALTTAVGGVGGAEGGEEADIIINSRRELDRAAGRRAPRRYRAVRPAAQTRCHCTTTELCLCVSDASLLHPAGRSITHWSPGKVERVVSSNTKLETPYHTHTHASPPTPQRASEMLTSKLASARRAHHPRRAHAPGWSARHTRPARSNTDDRKKARAAGRGNVRLRVRATALAAPPSTSMRHTTDSWGGAAASCGETRGELLRGLLRPHQTCSPPFLAMPAYRLSSISAMSTLRFHALSCRSSS